MPRNRLIAASSTSSGVRSLLATALTLTLVAALVVVLNREHTQQNSITAYFENSNGLFPGDDVRVLGVPVGKVTRIEPQPDRAKVTFTVDRAVDIPADAKAAILSPQLVTGRAIQLTPVYTGGPAMPDGAVIPQERTVVPVEWDDFRNQLQRLTDLLQPTEPGGVSTLGAFVNTAADNLRGQGGSIRDTVIKLSQTLSTLGDHSDDIFATFTNLSTVVTARQLNPKLFTVLRQNHVANRALFDAFESDFAMVPAEIVAHECLAILTTPLLAPFLAFVRQADDAWAETLLNDLTGRFGWDVPTVWSVSLNISQAPSVYRLLMRHEARLKLGDLLRAPVTERPDLDCRPLLLLREGDPPRLLPRLDVEIALGDQILFVGTDTARKELGLTLHNVHTLKYVLTGRDSPGGLIWEWLAARRRGAQSSARN